MADLSRATRDAVRDGCIRSAASCLPMMLDTIESWLGRQATGLLDVGAGEGHWLDVADAYAPHVHTWGVDLDATHPKVSYWDAEEGGMLPACQFDRQGGWDVVLCLEVAEHVTADHADDLVRELARATTHRGVVCFGAAIPGQGGDGHLNEQAPHYWAERFARHGYVCEDWWRLDWWGSSSIEPWYQQNLVAYRLKQPGEDLRFRAPPFLVHPAVFDQQHGLAAYWRDAYDELLSQGGGVSGA